MDVTKLALLAHSINKVAILKIDKYHYRCYFPHMTKEEAKNKLKNVDFNLNDKKALSKISFFFRFPLGVEPWTLYLKVDCHTVSPWGFLCMIEDDFYAWFFTEK